MISLLPLQSGLNTGQCSCKPHVTGLRCDRCQLTAYLNTSSGECQDCGCNPVGSHNASCTMQGRCHCLDGFQGDSCSACLPTLALPNCNSCQSGFYNFSSTGDSISCQPCTCSQASSVDNDCDTATGQCHCRPGFTGRDCTECDPAAATTGPGCSVCVAGFHSYNGSQ